MMASQTPARYFSHHHSSPLERHEARTIRLALDRGGVNLLILAAYCLLLFFYGITQGDLYRHENLRAVVGAEMLRTGDWIVPSLYGKPFLTKPPLMYMAIAAASLPFGEVTEWSARLPSALAATAVVFLLYWHVGRHVGRWGGLLTALVTPCTIVWLGKATAAEIDMLLVAWVTGALVCFFRAVESEERGERRSAGRWWLAALICTAGGVLTKWTGAAFFYGAAIPFLCWRGRLPLLWSGRHLLAALVGASLCLAWIAAVIALVGWNEFYHTVCREALPRLSHHHQESDELWVETLLHPFKMLLFTMPWSPFALLTLLPEFMRRWDERGRWLLQGLHCWAWPNLLLWTLLPDHTPRHSFPLMIGITALAALAWLAFLTGRLTPRLARVHLVMAASVLTFFILGAGGCLMLLRGLPALMQPWVVTVAMLVAGVGAAGLVAWRRGNPGLMLASLLVIWIVIKLGYVHLYVPVRTDDRDMRGKGELVARTVPAGHALYSVGLRDDGIMFYYGRPAIRLGRCKELPRDAGTMYVLTTERIWRKLQHRSACQTVLELRLEDEEGHPIILVGINTEPET